MLATAFKLPGEDGAEVVVVLVTAVETAAVTAPATVVEPKWGPWTATLP